jgi:hypothetical protein
MRGKRYWDESRGRPAQEARYWVREHASGETEGLRHVAAAEECGALHREGTREEYGEQYECDAPQLALQR